MGEARRRRLAGRYPAQGRAEYHDLARMIFRSAELLASTDRQLRTDWAIFVDGWNNAQVYDFGGCFNSQRSDFLGNDVLNAIRETAVDLDISAASPIPLTVFCFDINALETNGAIEVQPFGRVFVILAEGVVQGIYNHDGRIWNTISEVPESSYLMTIIQEAVVALKVWHEDFVLAEPTERAKQDAAQRVRNGEHPTPPVMRVRTIHLSKHRVLSHFMGLRQAQSRKRDVGSHERTLCGRVIHSRSKLGKPFSYTLKTAGQTIQVNAGAKPAVPSITIVAP